METIHIISFVLYTLTLLSFWIFNNPKVWIPLFCGTIILAYVGGLMSWVGILALVILGLIWFAYIKQKHPSLKGVLFLILLLSSFGFKFHTIPGFPPLTLSDTFKIGFEPSIVGFFPLALIIPFATTKDCWRRVFNGLWWGVLGIISIYFLAVASNVIHWSPKVPTFALTRYWAILFLMAIPEEAFFRGFVQHRLCVYLQNTKWGKVIAITAATLLFTLAHTFWAPSFSMLVFTFVAGLIYGGVYLKSGKIESAILTHFLLSFLYVTFF